jgi:hypothetical protein
VQPRVGQRLSSRAQRGWTRTPHAHRSATESRRDRQNAQEGRVPRGQSRTLASPASAHPSSQRKEPHPGRQPPTPCSLLPAAQRWAKPTSPGRKTSGNKTDTRPRPRVREGRHAECPVSSASNKPRGTGDSGGTVGSLRRTGALRLFGLALSRVAVIGPKQARGVRQPCPCRRPPIEHSQDQSTAENLAPDIREGCDEGGWGRRPLDPPPSHELIERIVKWARWIVQPMRRRSGLDTCAHCVVALRDDPSQVTVN